MPAETGLTVKTDIAPEISIDYVNRFSQVSEAAISPLKAADCI